MEYDFKYHKFTRSYSTVINELPQVDNVVSVYPENYWSTCKHGLERSDEQLEESTQFFAFVSMRRELPNNVGQGQTKEQAVTDLLEQLAT